MPYYYHCWSIWRDYMVCKKKKVGIRHRAEKLFYACKICELFVRIASWRLQSTLLAYCSIPKKVRWWWLLVWCCYMLLCSKLISERHKYNCILSLLWKIVMNLNVLTLQSNLWIKTTLGTLKKWSVLTGGLCWQYE